MTFGWRPIAFRDRLSTWHIVYAHLEMSFIGLHKARTFDQFLRIREICQPITRFIPCFIIIPPPSPRLSIISGTWRCPDQELGKWLDLEEDSPFKRIKLDTINVFGRLFQLRIRCPPPKSEASWIYPPHKNNTKSYLCGIAPPTPPPAAKKRAKIADIP